MKKLTPVMGFNTWNTFGEVFNEEVIKETADAMAGNGGDDHEGGAAQRQAGQNKTAEGSLVFLFAHPLDKHGDIEGIHGNDRKFR